MMHFASYYRWLVATQYFGLPRQYAGALLDVGTDAGEWPALIQAPLCVGIDLNARPAPHLVMVRGDAQALPLGDESFDHVWVFDVIEHVPDDHRLVAEALRVLRPGGCLWLSTTAHDYRLWPGGRVQERLEASWGHVRRGYRASELRALAPDEVQVEVTEWHEPLLRGLYTILKVIQPLPGGSVILRRLIPWIVAFDARRPGGGQGHLFVRMQVPTRSDARG